jgi:hypothetical protein
MPRIVISMEADKIAVENAEENLVSDGQDSIYFTAGEGCMQEEAESDILFGRSQFFPEHGW